MSPEFDELLGADVEPAERERLRRVHRLLVTAGPPPELPPEVEAGPTLAMTLARPRRPAGRRVALLAAALCLLVLVFAFGYIAGNSGHGSAHTETLRLAGTQAAPTALASLQILPADQSGNWPMKLAATGLPKLGKEGYYEVFLVRNGKIYAPCGSFIASGTHSGVDVTLNSPYQLQPHDTWVVTRQSHGGHGPGPVVLRPTTT
jgi:hypothetical protein